SDGSLASSIRELEILPAMLLAVIPIINPVSRRSSKSWALSAVSASIVTTIGAARSFDQAVAIGLGVHIAVLGAMVVSLVFRDRFAVYLRLLVAGVIPALAIAAVVTAVSSSFVSFQVAALYSLALTAAGVAVFALYRIKFFLCSSSMTTGAFIVSGVFCIPDVTAPQYERLVTNIEIGLACFTLAVVVSCFKAGLGGRVRKQFNRLVNEFRTSLQTAEIENPEFETVLQRD
ncbi:MAG: hypothetical protein AAF456_22590, partial [Planctomycetota bacterium]